MTTIRLLLVLTMLTTAACAAPTRTTGPSAQAVSLLENRGARICTPAIASALADEGIAPSSITSVNVTDERTDTARTDNVLAYDAWMRLEDQPGYLVVTLDDFCRVRQVYTRGGAEVAGVPAY